MIDEVLVNRWIQRYLNTKVKVYSSDEISVTEACSPCLRKAYYERTRTSPPSPAEFLKVAGSDIHLALQEVLRAEGWDVEVSVSIQLGELKLRGRVDAVKDDTVLEFKTVANVPEEGPYESHEMQTQAYLSMLKAPRGFIVYLSRANGKVKVFRVYPRKDALRQVIGRAKQLFQALKDNQPPPPARGSWCGGCGFKLNCYSKR